MWYMNFAKIGAGNEITPPPPPFCCPPGVPIDSSTSMDWNKTNPWTPVLCEELSTYCNQESTIYSGITFCSNHQVKTNIGHKKLGLRKMEGKFLINFRQGSKKQLLQDMSKNQGFEKSRLYCAYNAINTWRITYYFSTYHIGNHQAKVIRVSPATALNSNRNMSQWHVIIAETDLSTKNLHYVLSLH